MTCAFGVTTNTDAHMLPVLRQEAADAIDECSEPVSAGQPKLDYEANIVGAPYDWSNVSRWAIEYGEAQFS
jgi:hypothetical protein